MASEPDPKTCGGQKNRVIWLGKNPFPVKEEGDICKGYKADRVEVSQRREGKEKATDHDDHKWFGNKYNLYRSPFLDSSREYLLQKEREHQRNGGYVYKSYGKKEIDWNYPRGMCCSYCNEPFHYRKDCPKRIGKIEYMIKGTDGKTWNDIWYASRNRQQHATGYKRLFKNLEQIFGIEGNHEGFKRDLYKGKGNVEIYSEGRIHKIENVYYIPTLRRNVLSVDKLIEDGFKIRYDGDVCFITKEDKRSSSIPQNIHCWICNDVHEAYSCPNIEETEGDQGRKMKGKGKMESNIKSDKDHERWLVKEHYKRFNVNKGESAPGPSQRERIELYPTDSNLEDCTTFLDMVHTATQIDRHRIKFKTEFERLTLWFLKEFLEIDSTITIPPRDHMGNKIDLLELYMTVERFGGFEAVNKYDLWVQVAFRMGYEYGFPREMKNHPIVEEIRVTYVQYLEFLNWYHQKYKGREIKVEDCQEIEGFNMGYKEWQDCDLPPKKRSKTSSGSEE